MASSVGDVEGAGRAHLAGWLAHAQDQRLRATLRGALHGGGGVGEIGGGGGDDDPPVALAALMHAFKRTVKDKKAGVAPEHTLAVTAVMAEQATALRRWTLGPTAKSYPTVQPLQDGAGVARDKARLAAGC